MGIQIVLTSRLYVQDTFPIYSDKLVMDFSWANVFAFKTQITKHTSQSPGLVIDMVLHKAL
jgi:hypothetical protein